MKDGVAANRLANDPAHNIDAQKMLLKPKVMDDERHQRAANFLNNLHQGQR